MTSYYGTMACTAHAQSGHLRALTAVMMAVVVTLAAVVAAVEVACIQGGLHSRRIEATCTSRSGTKLRKQLSECRSEEIWRLSSLAAVAADDTEGIWIFEDLEVPFGRRCSGGSQWWCKPCMRLSLPTHRTMPGTSIPPPKLPTNVATSVGMQFSA